MRMKKYKPGEILNISAVSITPQTGLVCQLYNLPSYDEGEVSEIAKG